MKTTKRVTLIGDAMNASTEIIAAMLGASGLTVRTIAVNRLGGEYLDPIVCVSRVCAPEYSWLPEYLQHHGGYTYVLDDFLFAVDAKQDAVAARIFANPATKACLARFLRSARRVVARSPSLASALSAHLPGIDVAVVSAPVDWTLFDRLRAGASSAEAQHVADTICVGYPTTPREHLSSLIVSIVEGAERRFGNRVRFEFMGWWPFQVHGLANVTCIPGVRGYERYAEIAVSRRWDIGLAPVGSSLFENCKTTLKYLEYSAMGVAGIYSNSPLYGATVRHDETGLLVANTPAAWLDAIERLADDATFRKRIVKASSVEVRRDANMEVIGRTLREWVAPDEAA